MPQLSQRAIRRGQAGATTLISVMVLFFVMALVAAYGNRNLIVEQRVARTYHDLGVATEGAHQALARVTSLLNSGRIDANCSAAPAGPYTLRQWLLEFQSDGRIDIPTALGKTEVDPKRPYPLVCDRAAGAAWSCQCPATFAPVLRARGETPGESLFARIRGGAGIGTIDLVVQACSDVSAHCYGGEDHAIEAEAPLVRRLQTLTLLRALKMPPVSAVVSTGRIDLGTGMQAVHNEAAAGGVAIQAGGVVEGTRDRISGPSGSPAALALLANDALLAPLDREGLFRRYFGMALVHYTAQPAMRELRCAARCSAALKELTDAGHQLVWKEGDLTLDEEQVIGSADRPVVLIVKGQLSLVGPMQLHGLVFSGGRLSWSNASSRPSLIQGSVLVAGDVIADQGAVALFDLATLETLKLKAGSFVPVPGGLWSF